MLAPVFLTDSQPLIQLDLAEEIKTGLLAQSASISPKFLYDNLGSHLFTAITLLPEYYPTRIENEIFGQYRNEIAEVVGQNSSLIDLGAGNCQKAESLFESLMPTSYIAIDFSIEYLQEILPKLQNKYPQVDMYGVGMDFSANFSLPVGVPQAKRTFFYPGSSIGNFLATEAEHLLRQIRAQIDKGGLLLGVDLMKGEDILRTAYDDSLKLTAAFNLNILRVVNGLLGSDFDVKDFRHTIKVNTVLNRVELYLEALSDLIVSWPGNSRAFKRGELIHTENSHKYTLDSIQALLTRAGYRAFNIWTDPQDYFAVIYAQWAGSHDRR